MKKAILFWLLIMVLSCKKDTEPVQPITGKMTFYCGKDSMKNNRRWILYFNSEKIGPLWCTDFAPECEKSPYKTIEKAGGEYLIFFSDSGKTFVDSQYVTIRNGACDIFEYK